MINGVRDIREWTVGWFVTYKNYKEIAISQRHVNGLDRKS